jgi:transposase
MELARYVVEAVVLEGRSYREVARAHGISKSWVGKIVGRYRSGGYEAIAPRSRAARTIPHRTPDALEEEICALRKELTELGVDAGAATIAYHLSRRHQGVPSVSTIWRVLRRRGFVTPQPHKRPTELVGALRGLTAERVLAVRRDPLAPCRRQRGRHRELP